MEKIEHKGIVDEVTDRGVKVKIVSLSACAGCHAKGACTMADMQEKEIDIATTSNYKTGDQVKIVGYGNQGLKAAWWAYVLPMVLVIAVLSITFILTDNEGLAGLLSLLVLVPYYFIIKKADNSMKKKFQFTIKSINE